MPQVFYKDGSAVPDAKVGEAIASGQAFAKGRVTVRDEAGTIGTIDAAELGQGGYQPLSDAEIEQARVHERRDTLGQRALTVAEGAGRGATLGLSDVALTEALGDDYRKGALERSQEHPILAGVGEAGGMLAGALATGGVAGALGAPARGVAAAGRAAEGLAGAGLEALGYEGASAAARVAARAARLGVSGAVEGSLYGAGQAVSRTALDGSELSAEKVLASMGEGAVLGGVAGAGLGALAEGGSAALAKMGSGSGLRASAREIASESALKAAGAQGSDLRKLVGRRTGEAAAGKIDELGQELLHYEYKTGPRQGQRMFSAATKAEDLVEDIAAARAETGEALGVFKSKIDTAALENPSFAPKVTEYLAKVDSEVLAPLRESAVPAIGAQADKVEAQLATLRQRVEARESALLAEPQRVRLEDGTIELRPRVVPPEMTFAELDKVRRDLRSVFQPPRPTSGGMPPAVPEHAAHLEKAERILADHLDESAEKALTSMGQDPTEYRALKQQYSNLKDIEQITNKAAMQQLGNRAVSPSDYATGMGMGLGALMTGNVGALGYGVAASIAHKLVRERGRSVLAVLADHVATLDGGLDGAARRMAGALTEAPKKVLAPAALTASEIHDKYQHAAQAVREFQANTEAAGDRMARPVQHLVGEYPTLAQGVQQQISNVNTFLATKLPIEGSRAGATLTPQAAKSRIPPFEMSKFLRYVRGATNPQDVIADLSTGKIDREGLESIKAVFPKTFDELRTRVMTYTAERQDELPFQQRILLSLVFGFEGDKSMDPAFAADIQTAFTPEPETDQPRPIQLSPKVAADMTTPSQSVGQR